MNERFVAFFILIQPIERGVAPTVVLKPSVLGSRVGGTGTESAAAGSVSGIGSKNR